MLHVTAVRVVGDTRVWLQFNDGREGEVELGEELEGAVFAPLRDRTLFAQVAIDPDTRTIAWPNGADFAPEFLAERLAHRAVA